MMRCDPWRWLVARPLMWGRTEGSVASEQISSVVLFTLRGSPWTRLSPPPCLVLPLPPLRALLGALLYLTFANSAPKKPKERQFQIISNRRLGQGEEGLGEKRKEVKKPETLNHPVLAPRFPENDLSQEL